MSNKDGWLVQLPLQLLTDAVIEPGLTYANGAKSDLGAACADLGVDQVFFAAGPDRSAHAVISFSSELVPKAAAPDLAAL